MTFTPVLIRLSERAGFDVVCVLLATAGFSWMGFVFEFTCLGLAIDLFRLTSVLTQKIVSIRLLPSLRGKMQFLLPATGALVLCAYGFIEARAITVRHVPVTTSKLTNTDRTIKIVQISDLHLGLTFSNKRLRAIVDTINAESPDLVVATGDIVESHASDMAALVNTLQMIKAPAGKFAVTGNHEYYTGIVKSIDFLTQAGFTVLENSRKSVEGLDIVGVNDPTSRYMQGTLNSNTTAKAFDQASSERFTLLLKHRPVVSAKQLGHFDLQLSGHSHKGQLFPFNFLVQLQHPLPHSTLIDTQPGLLYVNPGTGTWGPPFRILAPPEITVLTLSPAGQTSSAKAVNL
nr:metallophosphoesterase [Desulfobulbaceae bacterium]